jgi:glyoxylase-like metal-dependent hydrolase (beta-lactamase superfamily II)
VIIAARAEHPGWLSNTYLVADRSGGTGVVVDAGGPSHLILEAAEREGLRVPLLLLTHRHHDHVAEAEVLAERLGARTAAHALELPALPFAAQPLEDGERLRAGGLEIEVLHIPGHTAGQAAFLVGGTHLFTGDTLFRGSVGGTVGPGASGFADLRRSLSERLMALPDEVVVLPGHTQATAIGREREENPFLRVLDGRDPEGEGRCRVGEREARLVVWARDYDGGFKAWVRFPEEGDAVVPGSRVKRLEGRAG